ncbi:NUDIX hydrolase [Streptomyces endophyticus]|uniref:NUDIX hydrolase n=1 Tax=Streptomyces endophyticus TaxID=714166 RepID=A0ABU6FJU0_9ACTN|nr:hypothetical protein [Streptomyces endophyticus]MEB8344104.1 hypothetical protein [Streptomyces endophyticus]
MTVGAVAMVFPCTPDGGTEQFSDESTAVTWLAPDDAMAAMREAYSIRIADALTGDMAPRIRTHDGRKLTDQTSS